MVKNFIYAGKNFTPMRLIRIVKKYNEREMSEALGISKEYFEDIEACKRNVGYEAFGSRLALIGIDWDNYANLERYVDVLLESNLSSNMMYANALTYAIGVVYPELNEKVESLISIPRKKKVR